MHPCLNHHFFERPISRENAAKYNILGNLCSPCMSVCMHFFEHHRGSHPRQPSRCLVNSITPFLESLHPYLNHHFFRHHGGAAAPPQPPPLRLDFLQRFNCKRFALPASAQPSLREGSGTPKSSVGKVRPNPTESL